MSIICYIQEHHLLQKLIMMNLFNIIKSNYVKCCITTDNNCKWKLKLDKYFTRIKNIYINKFEKCIILK